MHCWWDCELGPPLWKTVWRLLKKLKTELLYEPTIPFLGIYLKEIKTIPQKDIFTPRFIYKLKTYKRSFNLQIKICNRLEKIYKICNQNQSK